MSLFLTNSGASLVLANGGVPRQGKATIQWSDFSLVGAFQPPTNATYQYQGYGLTHRWRDDTLYLYSISKPGGLNNKLMEFPAPAGGASDSVLRTSAPWTRLATSRDYGRAWEPNTIHNPDDLGTNLVNANTLPRGLFWDETDQRMYWTFQHDYCNLGQPTICLGYSTLNDATPSGTNQKQFILTTGATFARNRFVQCVSPIPQTWADTNVGGRRLMVGCGWMGMPDESIFSNGGTGGPTLGAIHPPTTEDDLGTITGGLAFIQTWEGASMTRRVPYAAINQAETAVSSDIATFSLTDLHAHGYWVDVSDKHGVLVLTHEAGGNAVATIQASPTPTSTAFTVLDGSVFAEYVGLQLAVMHSGWSHNQSWATLQAVSGNELQFGTAFTGAPSAGDVVWAGLGYPGGTFASTLRWNNAYIYNPDDLATAASGAPYRTTPTGMSAIALEGLTDPFTGNETRLPRGVTFDSVTRRLYVLFTGTHTIVSGADGALVYVYELQ